MAVTPIGRIAGGRGACRRAAILMPAHNEGAGIARIIAALAPRLDETVRLVVVADNCADDTAAVALAAGATVIERHDASLRGKGHALAFGRDWLAQDPPDCVVVLDADCELEGESLSALIDCCVTSGRPVQSCYLLRSRPADAAMVQISNFAFLIKNLVRQRGAARIGAPAVLGGTGMAFPWALFRDAPLATSHLVEDLVLGIDFARAGHAPLFLESARTWSDPAQTDATRTQRTRWEHGFVHTAIRHALPLIGEGARRGRWSLVWLGLHLAVPPLALLMMLGVVALAASLLLALLGGSLGPRGGIVRAAGARCAGARHRLGARGASCCERGHAAAHSALRALESAGVPQARARRAERVGAHGTGRGIAQGGTRFILRLHRPVPPGSKEREGPDGTDGRDMMADNPAANAAPASAARSWLGFLLVTLSLVVEGFDLQSANFAGPSIIEHFAIGKAQLGPLQSASLVGLLVGAVSLAPLGDRFGRRAILIAGCIFYGLFSLVSAAATSFTELIILRFVIGIGLGAVLPNALALAGEFAPEKLLASAAGLVGIGITFGGTVAGATAAVVLPA